VLNAVISLELVGRMDAVDSDSPIPHNATAPPTPPEETTFSDDPVEHSHWSAAFMAAIIVTWLIFGHKIQGMFHWCAFETLCTLLMNFVLAMHRAVLHKPFYTF
jgi:hypothetical protein